MTAFLHLNSITGGGKSSGSPFCLYAASACGCGEFFSVRRLCCVRAANLAKGRTKGWIFL